MRIALHQFAPTLGTLEPNLDRLLGAIDRAAAAGATLVLAPEMALTGWTLRDPDQRAELAAAVERAALPALARAAARTGVGIIVGAPLPAPDAGIGATANCAIAIAAQGYVGVYRKIHLFGDERAWWVPGDRAVIADIAGVRVGLLICYDAEFPEVPRLTRLAGADVLAVAATNMTPYEQDQDVVFSARGLENECPVAVCNRVGGEGDWTYFGRSLVADERGRIVAQAGSGEELLIADIEPTRSGDPELSYLARRRPEVYGPLVEVDAPSGVGPSGT